MSTNNYRNSFPVVTGEIVCQGHADACAEFGHATYKIDGVDQGYCPRCNEVTEKAAEPVAASAAPVAYTPSPSRVRWEQAIAYFSTAFTHRGTQALLASDWTAFGYKTYTLEEYAERERAAQRAARRR